MSPVTEASVLEALRRVNDPELHKDLVSLGMVEAIVVEDRRVGLRINLTTPACPLKGQIEREIQAALRAIGAEEVEVEFKAQVRPAQTTAISGVKYIVAVASGKGGVGKSTVSANLAVALALEGAKVGLLDADIYGPSQAQMFGVQAERIRVNESKQMLPLERHGIKLLSIANLIPPGQAMIWRGPILHGTIKQFLSEVAWGELDYLIVDLPPGTGDVQLSLAQLAKLSGAVIVTTPQDVARIDAERALDGFKKVQVPILGVVENMSWLEQGGSRIHLFGQGGGRRMAEAHKTAFLGEIPLAVAVREGGDAGVPVVIGAPDSAEAQALRGIARNLAGQLSVQSYLFLPMT
ncbi:Mrp/NBP35 family ATP-binding protein [Meiothermus granaticius]|uniref:Iron-sulfur cluster carrier protein n=1 Tax=Meiothermus granaticius NBRC 107808 TaxID=1227551 RepID=A0A399F8B9_9DEIN|nr:Mrp/NBP35 family ATP-binding protein [Meiothermus granaticius]MCL6525902.1 Mrp/NBP35 family ATP-binding protein [Thermaceae bacterium]RIH91916.1 Iron-sulfur cluster carrier protein [Meiothermus granaticius NBRC 107808]GEM85464.1 iron-sulfur cluster carrier protein [Meiothermus granaticius NBRC 107808]